MQGGAGGGGGAGGEEVEGVQVGRFGVVVGGDPHPSPCPPSIHTTTINLTLTLATMYIALNTIPRISFMAAFATSLLSILHPNAHCNLSVAWELGLGSPSWWNQCWFYNPF